jgi:hypothetical protein
MIIKLSDILQEGKKEAVKCPLYFEVSLANNRSKIELQKESIFLHMFYRDVKKTILDKLNVSGLIVDTKYSEWDRVEFFRWLAQHKLTEGEYNTTFKCWRFNVERFPELHIQFKAESWEPKMFSEDIYCVTLDEDIRSFFGLKGYFGPSHNAMLKLMEHFAREIFQLAQTQPELLPCLQLPILDSFIKDPVLKQGIRDFAKSHGDDFGFLD